MLSAIAIVQTLSSSNGNVVLAVSTLLISVAKATVVKMAAISKLREKERQR